MKKAIIFVIFRVGYIFIQAQERYSVIHYPNKLFEGTGEYEFKNCFEVNILRAFVSENPTLNKLFELENTLCG